MSGFWAEHQIFIELHWQFILSEAEGHSFTSNHWGALI